jgi:hypothetical protein
MIAVKRRGRIGKKILSMHRIIFGIEIALQNEHVIVVE